MRVWHSGRLIDAIDERSSFSGSRLRIFGFHLLRPVAGDCSVNIPAPVYEACTEGIEFKTRFKSTNIDLHLQDLSGLQSCAYKSGSPLARTLPFRSLFKPLKRCHFHWQKAPCFTNTLDADSALGLTLSLHAVPNRITDSYFITFIM